MYQLNFSGKPISGTHEIVLNGDCLTQEDIVLEVARAVDEVRENILDAKRNGERVVLILPDNGVMAIGIFQAVRGLLGNRVPFVRGWNTEEIDTENIREAFRDSL
ncbi:hypothetical protein [Shimazuella kribbensis]|uniref:hypothetical protein n=1 Tax=Shimazuella kribbensis TaxID=139808 RepID=UPI0003F807B7|nr:hypothetical protein [Shimazuella kribbensis]